MDAQGIIVALRLQPHPKEGGYFNEANDRSDIPSTFGGNTRAGVHIDGIILNPDLHLDGRLVVSPRKVLAWSPFRNRQSRQ